MLTYSGRLQDEELNKLPTPHPNLCLAIRNLMLNEVSSNIDEESLEVKRFNDKIRLEIEFRDMRKRNPFRSVAGVDAGSQILPLVSRRYAVISALVYSMPSSSRFFLPPESFSFPYTHSNEKFNGIVNIRRETKLYETARAFIAENASPQLVLIDGPLAFSNWWGIAGKKRDRHRLVTAVNRFLNLCKEENIVVAGVVKRPSARYLVYHVGLKDETDLPDTFILLQSLRPGERTGVFSPRLALRRVIRAAPLMESIDCPIYSFYGRFSRDWFIPPLRIDLPAYSLSYLNEVADYCYWSGFHNGVPLPIIRADEEVRISKRFMGEIYSEIVSHVGQSTGEISHIAPYWGEGGWMGV